MESSNSPPDHPDSETSSGVHSNESGDHQIFNCGNQQQNTIFPENTSTSSNSSNKLPGSKVVPPPTVPETISQNLKWKSCSLHRCTRPDSAENSAIATNKYYSLNPGVSVLQEQLLKKSICPHNLNQSKNSSEDTLVICRKLQPFKLGENGCSTPTVDEQFGRSTNMRMSSFEHKFKSNHCTFSNISFASKNIYTQCPSTSVNQGNFNNAPNNGQNNPLYQRQHTTIPSHHNGVELYNHGHQYVKN